jgi:hypothetical protein
MRIARLLLLTAVVLGTALPTFAIVIPPEGGCTRTPDGYIACNAHCAYPASCLSGGGGYCYKDLVVNTCFDGGYDPCCGTAGLF